METTLEVGVDKKMRLINGAKAEDVFWRIGSSATFDVDSEVVGTFVGFVYPGKT
jgi:hypothetical protein